MELSVLLNKTPDKTENFLLSQLVLDNSSEGFHSAFTSLMLCLMSF